MQIREVHIASRQTYGAPRVHAELSAQGIACCRNTVAKLMRREQIMPRAIRHFRVTTDSRSTKEVSPNLVKRRFKAKRPNSCWLSDVTYIPTREGWLYLAIAIQLSPSFSTPDLANAERLSITISSASATTS